MTDRTSPETETLDAWVDSLPDDNGYWCGWHPVHGYGLHWGVRSSKSLIKLTEQNIKLGWEVRRVYLTDGVAQTPDLRKVLRSLCNEIEGIWDAFEYGLRAEISNTNYAVVRDKIEEARRILASPDTSTLQAKEEN